MNRIKALLFFYVFCTCNAFAETVFDSQRQRHIPIEISLPDETHQCLKQSLCPVAFVSSGYGVAHTSYQFLVQTLVKKGYLVVAIAHELPQDPPLSKTGNLYETRAENWQRGADTIVFLQRFLQKQREQKKEFEGYDFSQLLLAGHSNGGDISAWLANSNPELVKQVITLDHRRVPLPRQSDIKVLSIRASDFPADHGVLPSESETAIFPMCVHKIAGARHNDMTDYGPKELLESISNTIVRFLSEHSC